MNTVTPARSFRYILRYQIDPDCEPEARLAELIKLCREAQIEEVMLLFQAEELSNGHPTEAEWDCWLSHGEQIAKRLSEEGIALSLNPWSTLYQVPRGRHLHPGQNFRQMVGETGGTSPLIACPLCSEWQSYLSRHFARLALKLKPLAIWIEDDWRLHNHGSELAWGGCFCEEHLRRFSDKVGQTVNRETLIAAILRPGSPHPWRAQWLDLSRETLLEPIPKLRSAVEHANPSTKLALMSSRPDQHSIEGRDWAAMQSAMGNEPVFLNRPHMEPYTEERALRITATVTRQTIACLSGPIGIYPELENSPRCGVYSKSGRYTAWQMLEAAAIGSPGITINHFDNMGNGIALDPAFGEHLARSKPILSAVASLQLDDRQAEGVQVLFSTKIATHLHLPKPPEGTSKVKPNAESLSLQMQMNPSGGGGSGFEGSLQSLVHPSTVWAEVCTILGIAHRLTTEIDLAKGPILVSGQTLRTMDDAEIKKLLGACVVLDAVALEVLIARGYGEDLGIESVSWHSLSESTYSYERIIAPELEEYGVRNPKLCAQRIASRTLEIRYDTNTSTMLSQLHRANHSALWPAALLSNTSQGGTILSLAYPIDGSGSFFMAFFNRFRRIFLQNFLLTHAGDAKLMMGPDGSRIYRQATSGGTFIAVLNALLDPLRGVTLQPSDSETFDGDWMLLGDDGAWKTITPKKEGSAIHFDHAIQPMNAAFFMHCGPSEISFNTAFNRDSFLEGAR